MSIFGNFGRRVIEAREKQARGYVYASMLSMDDETIKNAGFTRDELKRGASTRYHF
jgi:hypothetical protein